MTSDPTPPPKASGEGEDRYAYRVAIKSIGIEAPLWTWQIDLEVGNGVLDWGQAHSRRQAVRQVTRRIKRHSRHTRKEQSYDWHRLTPTPTPEGRFRTRLAASMKRHKPILDRLREGGTIMPALVTAPPFAVGDEVEASVKWQPERVRGRVVGVDPDAPFGLCYQVATDDPSRPVLHLPSLHMRRA